MSNVLTDFVVNPVVGFFKPTPKPTVSEWVCHRTYQVIYVVWDAIGRIRSSIDGLDKSNKLFIAIFQGTQLYYTGSGGSPRSDLIVSKLKSVNDFFGGVGLFGRIQDLTGLDENDNYTILQKTPLKIASISFLTVAKSCELMKWLQSIDLLPVKWFVQADARYLGGIAARIGSTSLARSLDITSLGGTKNLFVVMSSAYGIVDNAIALIELKSWDAKSLAKIWLGIINDIGKIIMCLWFRWFTLTYTFVTVAVTVACIGLTKILFDSYTNPKAPFALPDWTKV